ncbi:MAG: cupin domain-containing protein [Brevundimonas sp.]|uniref:cupin domain-containing protein n=1 Tax=Brevundimonas sp. TaxID=1871086 RepID=UPI002489B5C4|nr:cupin domain-containing protein [Brevundimonas sp.]MDI1325345.1 cupin domain-containing protein [Brevundimonas sp.]
MSAGQASGLLEWMVGVPDQVFLSEVHEQKPLIYSGGDVDRFDALLTLGRLNDRLAEMDIREGMVEMTNARSPVDRSDYVENGVVDRVALARGYRNGATLVVNQLQHSDKRLADFCRALEQALSCHIQTNIYLTPPGEQGFRTHYDSHDVLVLQVEGEKTWRLYSEPAASPYRGEKFRSGEHAAGEASHSFVLRKGDCAYIPRGYFHDAANLGDSASLHITVGLIVRTWADLMLEAVSEVCLQDRAFRKALPYDYAKQDFDPARLQPVFDTLVARLNGAIAPTRAWETLSETFIRSREPDITDAIACNRADAATSYVARPAFTRVSVLGEEVQVLGPGSDFRFGRAPVGLVRRVLSGEPFRLAELDHPEAADVVERLTTAGLVRRHMDVRAAPWEPMDVSGSAADGQAARTIRPA